VKGKAEVRERQGRITGFDHGAGHPLLFLDDAKAPNCQKNNGFKDLGNYSEWPKVAGVVIKAGLRSWGHRILLVLIPWL
jgi:hypothetical protein